MTETTSPEAIAREIINQLEQGWNASDGRAFAAPFADDADFVNVRGEFHHGREAVAAGHQAIFDSIYRGSRIKCTLLQARRLADGVMAVHYQSDLTAPSGPLAGEHSAIPSFILVGNDDGWEIASFHNTMIAE
ncbi:MAG TPA: SgcJ/EcaC family oxidoreductase [Rhodothermales bacterium]|nr:SgcJ/EcaC family oxidoreductase [Rhodothermales bacterium]